MDCRHECLRFYSCGITELDRLLLHTFLQSFFDPLTEGDEVLPDFNLNFLRQAWKFSAEQSCDAERFRHIADAGFPVVDIFLQPIYRRRDMLV